MISEGGEGVRGEDPAINGLKNIRGFILKRRKSPLKGWHKVSEHEHAYFGMKFLTHSMPWAERCMLCRDASIHII